MADPAMRQAIAYAIDKNEINTRLLGGTAQVANTNISPGAWFYADQPPATYDPEKAKQILEAGRLGGLRRRRHPREGRPEGQDRAVHDDPPGPPGHARAHRRLAEGGRHRRASRTRSSPDDIFADYNEATRDTPCALSRSNFDLAEHAFISSIDPLGNYFSYHSSQFEPDGANDAQVKNPDVDSRLDDGQDQRRLRRRQGRHGRLPEGLRRADRRGPALLPQERRARRARPSGTSSRNPTQAGPTWNAGDWFNAK